jgi:hypothetical protein
MPKEMCKPMTDAEQFHILLPLMRGLFRNLEKKGAVDIGPDEQTIFLRHVTLSELAECALAAGLPEPGNGGWAALYRCLFGAEPLLQ